MWRTMRRSASRCQQALATAPEHAVGALERLVPGHPSLVLEAHVRQSALEIADRERRLVARSGGARRLEVEVGRAVVALAAREVARDDGRRQAARERRLGEMLAEGPVHPHAVGRVERDVRDVARERVAEVDVLAFAVAEAARAQPHDGLVVGGRGQLEHVAERERTAGDREPVDHRVLGRWQLADAITQELLERRRQRAEAGLGPLGASQHGDVLARVVLRLADLEGAALEERVDHLEQEERVAADRAARRRRPAARHRARRGASRRGAPAPPVPARAARCA